jgi:hypothetical protein
VALLVISLARAFSPATAGKSRYEALSPSNPEFTQFIDPTMPEQNCYRSMYVPRVAHPLLTIAICLPGQELRLLFIFVAAGEVVMSGNTYIRGRHHTVPFLNLNLSYAFMIELISETSSSTIREVSDGYVSSVKRGRPISDN